MLTNGPNIHVSRSLLLTLPHHPPIYISQVLTAANTFGRTLDSRVCGMVRFFGKLYRTFDRDVFSLHLISHT
jgi:hypothetical protein